MSITYKRFITPNGGTMFYHGDDELTPISKLCIACHGKYRDARYGDDGSYSHCSCRWCCGGLMDQKQIVMYLEYAFQRKSEGKVIPADIEKMLRFYVKDELP